MDLRTKKTRQNIVNVFIKLRAQKPLEKISVKELCDEAQINKTTFYRHFTDIYDLSETIEDDIIRDSLSRIGDPDKLFERDGVHLLAEILLSQSELTHIIFSGSRIDVAMHKLHDSIMGKICERHPEYRDDVERKVILTALIYGTFMSYFKYRDEDFETVINGLATLTRVL